MSKQGALGQFEQVVLTMIVDLADAAYGVTIHRAVSELSTPRIVSLGAVYATLDRLEDKGMIASLALQSDTGTGRPVPPYYRL